MKQIKYFSMFSGIGGFEYGIDRAFSLQEAGRGQEGKEEDDGTGEGLHTIPNERASSVTTRDNKHANGSINQGQPHCVGYSEIDKYADAIYKYNFGGRYERRSIENESEGQRTGSKEGQLGELDNKCSDGFNSCRNWGDATKINPEELPDFDLLVGGFPCQAFSIAGKRQGFKDTRGTLFFDIARILKHKRPRHFILENVKGLLSHDSGETFKTILKVLSDIGYRVEWQILNSKFFGVPQNRERVYIVGHLRGECGCQVFPIRREDGEDAERGVVAGTLQTGYAKGDRTGGYAAKKETRAVLTPDRENKRQNGRRIKDNNEPSFILTGQDKHGVTDGIKIRRLTPTECERLQGFPDGWTAKGIMDGKVVDISDTQRYKTLGNAVTTTVVESVVRKLYDTQKG